MPVNDREGRADPKELYNKTFHSSHWATCPAAQEFKAQQAAERAAALAADQDMLTATTRLMEARKALEAQWAAAAATVKPRPKQRAVIAKIGKLARELTRRYSIPREQLQKLARSTVGVSSFKHLYAVPVTWLKERLLWALEMIEEVMGMWYSHRKKEMPAGAVQTVISNAVSEAAAHFASCCQQRAEARGLVPGGGDQ